MGRNRDINNCYQSNLLLRQGCCNRLLVHVYNLKQHIVLSFNYIVCLSCVYRNNCNSFCVSIQKIDVASLLTLIVINAFVKKMQQCNGVTMNDNIKHLIMVKKIINVTKEK